MDLRERAAQASGRYTDEEWVEMASSDDPLDQFTITNARAVAANILELPEIKEALEWRANANGIAEAITRNRAAGYNQTTDRCDIPLA
jgi:hypothetical protein